MQGFGIHTFRLVNAEGKGTFVKFHFTPELGTHSLVWDEALKLAGVSDGDSKRHIFLATDFRAWLTLLANSKILISTGVIVSPFCPLLLKSSWLTI